MAPLLVDLILTFGPAAAAAGIVALAQRAAAHRSAKRQVKAVS